MFDTFLKLVMGVHAPGPLSLNGPQLQIMKAVGGPCMLVRRENITPLKAQFLTETSRAIRILDTGHPLVVIVQVGRWCEFHGRFHFTNEP
jgi:hypothetical protein